MFPDCETSPDYHARPAHPEMVRRNGWQRVTLGSDAHRLPEVSLHLEKAIEAIRQWGSHTSPISSSARPGWLCFRIELPRSKQSILNSVFNYPMPSIILIPAAATCHWRRSPPHPYRPARGGHRDRPAAGRAAHRLLCRASMRGDHVEGVTAHCIPDRQTVSAP